jgi:hypothetical protein
MGAVGHNLNYSLLDYNRSSVGPEFARKRGLIFLILTLVFIAVGVGVTVINLIQF